MPSAVAWLDASEEEHRRVREIVALFAQRESRDELGIGQIRDALSDLLFPGTSVIQTRARYFLMVPWLFRLAEARRIPARQVSGWVQNQERRLVEVLRKQGAVEGLIGLRAGPTVKILPSTIYWSGLQRWGILTAALSPDQVALRGKVMQDDADELAERQGGAWHPTLPTAPAGFPDDCPGGFDLTVDEAEWLRDRILDRTSGSLLAHLVAASAAPDPSSAAPWFDPATVDAPPPAADVLTHARWFSLAMHGPALLYNLLVAEAYVAAGHTALTDVVIDWYRKELDAWVADVEGQARGLSSWNIEAFWSTVMAENPRIGPHTRQFVDLWIKRTVDGTVADTADDQELRGTVRERERLQKKNQARLSNPRLLAAWTGASGAAPLTFRWYKVRRIVTDIHDAMGHDHAGA